MDPKEAKEVTAQTLLALRQESDALRVITEKLRVEEMGPADHIRTKHEVKLFVESGDPRNAEELIKRAHERREQQQTATIRHSQKQRARMND